MKEVWKYNIRLRTKDTYDMPKGAKFLHGAATGAPDVVEFCMEVIPDLPKEPRHFAIFGTGQRIDEFWEYQATVLASLGLVWHLYEFIKPTS